MKMKKIIYVLPLLLMSQVSLGQHSEMWGTTLAGGQYDAGFAFKMNPDGSDYEIVYAFNGTSTGQAGYNQLTQGNDGLLYGVTGGTGGAGTIFTIDPVSGEHTVVHYFNPFNYVRSKLRLATNGKFYGIGSGFMFEFDPSNKSVRIIDPWDSFSVLFGEGFLLEIEPNVLYGAAPGFGGAGAIFKYDVSTDTYTTLHFFNGEDGDYPNSDLLLGSDSLLYGTTIREGANNRGTLFSYDLKKDTLVVEAHLESEHNSANGGLVQHENGLIFGTTTLGGSSSSGSIFEFNPTTKVLRTVYTAPSSSGILLTPMLGFNGNIYVMSRYGGSGAGFGRIVAYDPSSETTNTNIASLDDGFPFDNALLEIGEREVTALSISPQNALIDSDDGQITFTSSILPIEAAGQSLDWEVSNQSIATISSTGILTALDNGVITVTARANKGLGISTSTIVNISNQDGNQTTIAVEEIRVQTTRSEINTIGGTQQLNALVLPSNASDQSVSWSVSSPGQAAISPTGVLTALDSGRVVVTATANDGSNIQGTLTVDIRVLSTSVVVTSPSDVINVDDGTLQLTANVSPESTLIKDVIWSISDENIATISEDGLVQALLDGVVTVSARAWDSGVEGSKQITISNQIPFYEVTDIIVTGPTNIIDIEKGTLQLAATVIPDSATITEVEWYSIDPDVATVDQNGLVTARKNGEAIIVAEAMDGSRETGVFEVFVSNQPPVPLTSFDLSIADTVILVGESERLRIRNREPSDAENLTVHFSTSDSCVLSVERESTYRFLLTGVSPGEATVSVTIENANSTMVTRTVSITVSANPDSTVNLIPADSIAIQSTSTEISTLGGSLQLIAELFPKNTTTEQVKWRVSDSLTASISPTGLLTALDSGSVTVVATSCDSVGVEASLDISIRIWITHIEVTSPTDEITIDDGTLQMTALVSPHVAQIQNVAWSVSNDSIATISENGLVQARSNGVVIVSAEATDGTEVVGSKEITISNQTTIDGTILNVEWNDEPEILFWPNPTHDILYVEGYDTELRIEIYSIAGILMSSFELSPEDQMLDLSGTPAGTYFLKVLSNQHNFIRQIVVK